MKQNVLISWRSLIVLHQWNPLYFPQYEMSCPVGGKAGLWYRYGARQIKKIKKICNKNVRVSSIVQWNVRDFYWVAGLDTTAARQAESILENTCNLRWMLTYIFLGDSGPWNRQKAALIMHKNFDIIQNDNCFHIRNKWHKTAHLLCVSWSWVNHWNGGWYRYPG